MLRRRFEDDLALLARLELRSNGIKQAPTSSGHHASNMVGRTMWPERPDIAEMAQPAFAVALAMVVVTAVTAPQAPGANQGSLSCFISFGSRNRSIGMPLAIRLASISSTV